MSLRRNCDLCGKPILPLDNDSDWMGSGVPYWGSRYEVGVPAIRKRMWRRHTMLDVERVLDAHDSCVEKLFAAPEEATDE